MYITRDVVRTALNILCAATGHAGGCWLLNTSPLRRLWHWSLRARVSTTWTS
jgi:hypothetical protein